MTRTRVRLASSFATLAVICWCTSTVRAQAPAADGWVVLPVDEYRALRERTFPQPDTPPAIASTLTRIDYDLRTDGDALGGRALLTLDVLRDGWTRVEIPPGLTVRGAILDGRPAAIVTTPAPHVLLDRAGRFVVELDVVVPLQRSAGTDAITLPASSSPVSRVALLLPRADMDLSATGGFVAGREDAADGTRSEHVLVTGGTTTTLTSTLSVGPVHEMVTVTAEAPTVDVQNARQTVVFDRGNAAEASRRAPSAQAIADSPTQRVFDLQSRAAGVLPVRVDVPRAGTSHKFIRPLVVDEETVVTLRYRRR